MSTRAFDRASAAPTIGLAGTNRLVALPSLARRQATTTKVAQNDGHRAYVQATRCTIMRAAWLMA